MKRLINIRDIVVRSLCMNCFAALAMLTLVSQIVAADSAEQGAKKNEPLDESVLKLPLTDIKGRTHTLAEEKSSIVVYFFLGLECPVANTYVSEVNELIKKYEKDKIAWIGIHSDKGVTSDAAIKHADQYKLQLRVMLDPDQKMAAALDAKRLGQVVVVKDKKVVYRGRIDDRFATNGKRRDVASTHELADVLTALVAGKDVPYSEVAGYGCPIPVHKK